MQLPVDKEHNEEVVRVPEPLKVCTATLLNSKPDHDTESSSHDPAGETRTSNEVRSEEGHDLRAGTHCVGVCQSELGEIDHVCGDVDKTPPDNRPSGGLVERDVLVERNVVV